jgi:hypothetical protein
MKDLKSTVPAWLQLAAGENHYIAAVLAFAEQAHYGRLRFYELLARGLYHRCKLRTEDCSTTDPPPPLPVLPPLRKTCRRAATLLLLPLAFSVLAACTGPQVRSGTPCLPALPVDSPGTLLDDDRRNWVRNDEQLRQYTLNPYRDPNNPNLRHDGHNVQRLEQSADWNLRQNPPLDMAAESLPNQSISASVLNPVKAELEQKLAEQQKYMALIVEQNELLLLRDGERRERDTQVETLKAQTTDLQQQVGAMHRQLDAERALREQAEADAKARP